MLKESSNALQQAEKFKYLVGRYTWVTQSGTRSVTHGLVKQPQYYVSFIAPWSQNGSFQPLQSSLFEIGLFPDPRLWSWILGNDWKILILKYKRQNWDFCENLNTVWQLTTKCTAMKFGKPWM